MKSNGESTAHAGISRQKADFGCGEIRQIPQVMRLFPGKTRPGASPAAGSEPEQ